MFAENIVEQEIKKIESELVNIAEFEWCDHICGLKVHIIQKIENLQDLINISSAYIRLKTLYGAFHLLNLDDEIELIKSEMIENSFDDIHAIGTDENKVSLWMDGNFDLQNLSNLLVQGYELQSLLELAGKIS